MGFKVPKGLGLKPIQKWHTPFMQLDFSLGGGFGEGVWIETFAPEGLGKTTLYLQSASIYLAMNSDAYLLFLDVEKALDTSTIQNFFYQEDVEVEYETGTLYIDGEDRGKILMPDTYEQISEITEEFIKFCKTEKRKGLIIWDSLVSATSEKMLKEGKEKVAFKATAIQEYLEQYLAEFRKAEITLLVINQIRDKMNTGFVMGQDKGLGSMIDDTYHIPGGKYHKFMSFQALMLVSGKKWKYGSTSEKITGKIVKIIPTKNKQAPDRRQVDLIKVDDYGFSNIISLLEFLKSQGVMSGTMAGMKFSGELSNIFPKKVKLENFVETLIEEPDVLDLFYKVCFNQLMIFYKEQRRVDRYNSEVQKKIILLDAIKLKRYLDYINSMSVDSVLGESEGGEV
jgi:RecA/RadA recombinase